MLFRSRLAGLRAIAKPIGWDITLTLDPTERHGFEYQSWIGFSIFAAGARREIGRGGAYQVMHEDGREEAAIGFSLFVDPILDAGLAPVEYQYFDDAVVGRLAVVTGRADISFEPNATGAYSARDGKVRRVGLFPGGWPNAAAISVTTRKGSGLAEAVTQALNTQIGSGTYAQALARWNLAEEAVPRSQTNPPGLPSL